MLLTATGALVLVTAIVLFFALRLLYSYLF